jgi:hypothetical protein
MSDGPGGSLSDRERPGPSRREHWGIYFRCPMLSVDTRGKSHASVNIWYRASCGCPQTEVPNGVQGVAGSNPAVPTTFFNGFTGLHNCSIEDQSPRVLVQVLVGPTL